MAGEIKKWLRFRNNGTTGFGTLTSSGISVHEGEMFGRNTSTGRTLSLSEVELLAPCAPSKIVALWNNFHALAAKLNQPEPPEPLYLLKATTTIAAPGAVSPMVILDRWFPVKVRRTAGAKASCGPSNARTTAARGARRCACASE